MVSFFEQRRKVTLKWLNSCERKERQVKSDVKELKESKNEFIKIKEVRMQFDEGRQNFVTFIEVHKLVVADDVIDTKKSSEAERDVNSISGRVEHVDKILHEQEAKYVVSTFILFIVDNFINSDDFIYTLDSSVSSKLLCLEVQQG